MSIHEECGVFGIISNSTTDVGGLSYYGLYALQHRGQEGCGIVVNHDGLFYSHKDLGLVSEVFGKEELSKLPEGEMAVGHVRYGTTGGNNRSNCQPIVVNHQKGRMALAHNGNLSNAADLRDELELSGAIFHTTSDTETIAYIITKERIKCGSIEDALTNAMEILQGAYSLCLMSPQKLICARDPHGFRPLCFGKTKDGSFVVASESCALHAVGAEFIRDVEPGEIMVFSRVPVTEDGAERTAVKMQSIQRHCYKAERKICIFEYIYFARPDSVIDGISVHSARVSAGRQLAKEHPVSADMVIGVPDSGLDAAIGYSLESGIPYGIGLIKNKYIGRTFIAPDHRLDQVKIKLAAIEDVVKGKRIVLIDDSIVRGTTSGRLVSLLREAGAKEIHMRISAPPFLHPCYYGTDIDSEEHLIANKHTVPEIAEIIGADSLGYLPVEKLGCLMQERYDDYFSGYCSACFDGRYPTRIPEKNSKDRFERPLSEVKKS
ncbi:MAG: amidophosphoribosyltransferase [Lachnospiraceae bacterium]|nr:amidophosphoribosyltransferase [Lachnospiraceae bacterium]